MVCPIHPKAKKGRCKNCKNFKCCPPLLNCQSPDNHPKTTSIPKTIEQVEIIKHNSPVRPRTLNRKSYLEDDDKEEDFSGTLPYSGVSRWNQEKINPIFSSSSKDDSVFFLVHKLNNIPKNGFKKSRFDKG